MSALILIRYFILSTKLPLLRFPPIVLAISLLCISVSFPSHLAAHTLAAHESLSIQVDREGVVALWQSDTPQGKTVLTRALQTLQVLSAGGGISKKGGERRLQQRQKLLRALIHKSMAGVDILINDTPVKCQQIKIREQTTANAAYSPKHHSHSHAHTHTNANAVHALGLCLLQDSTDNGERITITITHATTRHRPIAVRWQGMQGWRTKHTHIDLGEGHHSHPEHSHAEHGHEQTGHVPSAALAGPIILAEGDKIELIFVGTSPNK